MPVRGLLAALVVLAALVGAAYWSERNKAAEDAKQASGGESKLVSVKEDDVRKVEIRRANAPAVVLERDKSNQWQMAAPETWRVDQDAANGIATAYSGLTYDRVVEEKAADLSSYGLQTPGVEVAVTTKDGKSRKLLIGEETPTGSGVFAKFADQARVFTLLTGTKTSLDKTAQDLRDKRLLVFEADKLARVELAAKGGVVEFGRNARNEWQIVKPKPFRADNGQVEELVRKLGDARMDGAALAEGAAWGTRIALATVGTQTLEVRKKGEDYFAKSSMVEGVYKVPSDLGESLNKSLDDFRNKKLFDFGFDDPSSIRMRDDAKTYSFDKSGEKWTANGKQMDPTSVQSFIDKLRDLSSIRFVDAGFTTPLLELSVTSGGGKRVEKVQISKSGNSYFARREGEPAIYELDSKAVEELQRAAADVAAVNVKEPPPPPKK